VALTYRVTVDVPARFKNSKAVGAAFGLTPARYQSGESDRTGGISRCGDEMMRMMLYEAAQTMLVVSTKWSWLKAWAMKIAKNHGMKKAIVALARRLAVIMHRINAVEVDSKSGRRCLTPNGRLEKRTSRGKGAMADSVESRMGAVAWGLWPTLRFPSPLIETDVPISGIRLSNWFHREALSTQ
jgi:hypothetical protein